MTHLSGASHIGSCFSVLDIVSVLYSSNFDIRLENWKDNKSNRVILSKGHSIASLYAALATKGFFPIGQLDNYCKNGSMLGGHPNHLVPGVELSTGSLGHGLPYATGIALAKKKLGYEGQVFVIMSDGELDEGTTWESALFAQHNNLCNLTVIVDRNFLQSLESTESTLSLEPLDEKFRSFNWEVETIDGHDHIKLINVLSKTQLKPKLIIAETIKGKGVSFMENEVKWHYKSPNQEEFEKALKEIENMDTL
jgi:transketolase